MDRLIEAIDNTQNPSVVGLDPTEALVPPQVVASFADEVRDSVESPEEVESAQLAVAYFDLVFILDVPENLQGLFPPSNRRSPCTRRSAPPAWTSTR